MKEYIENRMVIEPEWKQNTLTEVCEILNPPGYTEIGTGVFVPKKDAFGYALEHCFEVIPEGIGEFRWIDEFKEMLVGWFYSGNWVEDV